MRRISRFAELLAFLIVIGIFALSATAPRDRGFAALFVAPPAPRTPLVKAQALSGCVYLIRPGDNLFRIGLRYGVSYTYLAQLNGIPNPALIYAGATLAVPCDGSGQVPNVPANCAPNQQYTVVAGDNLFRIAYNFKTDLNLLRARNNMFGRVLRPGMVLTIPCPGSVHYRELPPLTPTDGGAPPPPAVVTPIPTTPGSPPIGQPVNIENHTFDIRNMVITPGTSVNWFNNDGQARTVVILLNGQIIATSPSIRDGGFWTYTFNSQGTYTFQFKSDPNVNGMITVRNPS